MTATFTDLFNRAGGPIGNGWIGTNWVTAVGAASNTALPGANLILDGDMEEANPLARWTAAHGATVQAVADERTGGSGSQSSRIANGVNASAGGMYQLITAPVNTWLMVDGWLKAVTGDIRITLRDAIFDTILNTAPVTEATWTNQFFSTRLLTANGYIYPQMLLPDVGLEGRVDGISVRAFDFADLIALRPARVGHCTSSVKIVSYMTGTQVGLIHSYLDANNFLLVFYDGNSIAIRSCIAGVYVNRAKDLVTLDSNAELTIVSDGDTVQVWYAGVRIGPAQYLPQLSAGTSYGLFSTHASNLLDDYSLADTIPADYSTRIRGVDLRNDLRGTWSAPNLLGWMDRMPDFGVEWIVLNTLWYQDNINTTDVYENAIKTPTDLELGVFIDYLHSQGFKVALKPLLNLTADPGHGRNKIGLNFLEADFAAWFASYQVRLLNYATLCQAHAVDLFVIGTEFTCIEPREAEWRALVAAIKVVYSGLMTYASDRVGYTVVAWWDLMDYLSIDAYFILHDHVDPTLAETIEGWAVKRTLLDAWSKAEHDKQIIFTEVGYSSARGTAMEPYRYLWTTPDDIDLPEQDTCYQALLEIFRPCAWLGGMFLWELEPFYVFGGNDVKFSPFGKPAGETLKTFWNGRTDPLRALERTDLVKAEDRLLIVGDEIRERSVPLEDRTIILSLDLRTFYVLPERRVLEVV